MYTGYSGIDIRFPIYKTCLCLHFCLTNPGQNRRFSLIWSIAFSKFLKYKQILEINNFSFKNVENKIKISLEF